MAKNMKMEAPAPPKMGDTVKVFLPGESPFVQVCRVWDELTIQGRFEAKQAWEHGESTLHYYKKGDDATFFMRPRIIDGKLYWNWELSPMNQQQSLEPEVVGEFDEPQEGKKT